MSVKTSLSPALSGSSKLYSPITSPARQDLPARRNSNASRRLAGTMTIGRTAFPERPACASPPKCPESPRHIRPHHVEHGGHQHARVQGHGLAGLKVDLHSVAVAHPLDTFAEQVDVVAFFGDMVAAAEVHPLEALQIPPELHFKRLSVYPARPRCSHKVWKCSPESP